MRFGVLAFALCLAASTAPALAQSQPQPQAPDGSQDMANRFQAYVTSDGYKNMLGQLAVFGDTISAPDCKDHKPKERVSLTVYMPPVFAEGTHPSAGLWVDRVNVDRCGKTVQQNVMVRAQATDQPPRAALLMPGTTVANPPMQDLIMKDVVATLGSKNKCTDLSKIIPVDSRKNKDIKPIKVDDKGMITEGSWTEVWSFMACEKKTDITVEMGADGKGGMNHKIK